MAVGSTRAKRKLGRMIGTIMDRQKLKVEHVVAAIGTSRGTMFKLLAGDHRPQKPTFIALLTMLHISDEERATLHELYGKADVDAVAISDEGVLSKNYVRFRRDEAEAELARTLDGDLIPGMLQLPEYTQALAAAAWRLIQDERWRDSETIGRDRIERSQLLTRPDGSLRLRALIAASALAKQVGGRELMRRQYDYLITMSELPNVEIMVIPNEVGAYGVHNGALTLLHFPLPDDEPVSAYIDTLSGIGAVKGLKQVQALSDVWDDVTGVALSVEDSTEYIREIRDSLP